MEMSKEFDLQSSAGKLLNFNPEESTKIVYHSDASCKEGTYMNTLNFQVYLLNLSQFVLVH